MEKVSFDKQKQTVPSFFLGANSGEGFYSVFHEMYQPETGDMLYILKGGPGTGKSTLMKTIASHFISQGKTVQLYYCSSDPDSLDGVYFPDYKAGIVDGTAPHIMEPKYLGISETIINVGEFLDTTLLQNNCDEILSLYRQNKKMHNRASRFLAAAAGLVDDSFSVDCTCTDMAKVEAFARNWSDKIFPSKNSRGKETRRFLSGFTPKGSVLLENTLQNLADDIVVIDDEIGVASSVILSIMRAKALDSGYHIITCPCALSPHRKIDHLIIPEMRFAITTGNVFLPITVDTMRRIHTKRFRDHNALSQKKQRLRFNKRATEELIDGACDYLRKAKEIHDLLEQFYIEAMNFDDLQLLTCRLQDEIENRIKS